MSQVTGTQHAQTLGAIGVPQTPRACPYGISVKKAVLVGLGLLLLAELPSASAQGIAATLGAVGAAATLKTFSPSLAHGVHPGFITSAEGSRYCHLVPQIHISLEECEEVSALREGWLKREHPEPYKEMYKTAAESGKGLMLGHVPGQPSTPIELVTIANNPKEYTNHQKALQFVETQVLKTDVFTHSPAAIVKTIQETHKIITAQLADASGGDFRTENVLVLTQGENTYQSYAQELMRNGGTTSDLKVFKKAIQKIETYGNFDKAFPHFSKVERAVWKKIGHLGTSPDQIAKEMAAFAKAFKARTQWMMYEGGDVVATAAWVHQQIGRIHPFEDGNGRLARLWMNTVLQLGGIQGVLFYDEDAYVAAVRMDQSTPGHFTQFLEEIIQWNQRHGFIRPVF